MESARWRSGINSGFLSRHSFHATTPCRMSWSCSSEAIDSKKAFANTGLNRKESFQAGSSQAAAALLGRGCFRTRPEIFRNMRLADWPAWGIFMAPTLRKAMALIFGFETTGVNWMTIVPFVTVTAKWRSTAVFTRPHAPGFRIVGRGNPGPRPRYNPADDPEVVPYYSIIH